MGQLTVDVVVKVVVLVVKVVVVAVKVVVLVVKVVVVAVKVVVLVVAGFVVVVVGAEVDEETGEAPGAEHVFRPCSCCINQPSCMKYGTSEYTPGALTSAQPYPQLTTPISVKAPLLFGSLAISGPPLSP